MKATNLVSTSGNKVPNQFVIQDDSGNVFFQSYESIIAKIDQDQNTVLDEIYWNYSKTTSKYLNRFLGMTGKEVKKAVKIGNFKLANLN